MKSDRERALEQLVAEQDALLEEVRALLRQGRQWMALSLINERRPMAVR